MLSFSISDDCVITKRYIQTGVLLIDSPIVPETFLWCFIPFLHAVAIPPTLQIQESDLVDT